ncbi:unnamed protein product [Ostreobium quekettii]|uniref:Fungal lipase-type domain-containing protein n=1 Tax=Ostreobium quekettii TaxID=121088 RepID=A0A8S1J2Y2_9CHLO|nr:unnamed protein product [Ostreobium quekettii]|eukprot:evm.model.scf_1137.1 EVM.evm.TU.scf_1137.1   scf_1137:11620-12926(-)
MSQGPFETFAARPASRKEQLANAYALVVASQLSYRRAEGGEDLAKPVRDQLGEWGFRDADFIGWEEGRQRFMKTRSANTQAFTARGDGFWLVCFRGSDMLGDWFTNSMFTQSEDGPFGRVHSGFLAALNEPSGDGTVLGRILATVAPAARESSLPVYVTGHSLGGACATLAAAYLHQRGVDVAGVYTYGCPRVGDATFAQEYDGGLKSVTHRFVNGEDWVTDLPRTEYSHVGTSWVIRDGVVGESDDGPSADGQDFGLIGELEDHDTQKYVDALEKAWREG